MSFTIIHVTVSGELSEILQAELADFGFDAFMETETGFEGSVETVNFQEEATKELVDSYNHGGEISYSFTEEEKQNWNKLWETNFHPIEINQDCYIRAAFHEPIDSYKYQLVITPKMSFGTGHHSTTSLMIQQQLLHDHVGKTVFDIGCGTGVLAIMAMKLGATAADACDVEDWSVENTLENAENNQVSLRDAYVGTVEDKKGEELYDILLANINLNVHKASFGEYVRILKTGGKLLVSGFYEGDIPTIEALAQSEGIKKTAQQVLNEWTCIVFEK